MTEAGEFPHARALSSLPLSQARTPLRVWQHPVCAEMLETAPVSWTSRVSVPQTPWERLPPGRGAHPLRQSEAPVVNPIP